MASQIYLSDLDWAMSDSRVARGDDSSAIVQVGSGTTMDEFGVDALRLPVDVRTDLVPDFLPDFGNLDPIYRKLKFVDHTVANNKGWRSLITAKFEGFLKDRHLVPKREAGTTERTVALRGAGGITLTVTYNSPGCRFLYALSDDPLAPSFEGELSIDTLDFTILDIRATGGDLDFGIDPDTWGWDDFTANGYLWTKVIRNTGFTRTENAPGGGVWRISEENSGLVIPKTEI